MMYDALSYMLTVLSMSLAHVPRLFAGSTIAGSTSQAKRAEWGGWPCLVVLIRQDDVSSMSSAAAVAAVR